MIFILQKTLIFTIPLLIVALGRDFDDRGQLKGDEVVVVKQAQAHALADALQGATFDVSSVEHKPYTRKPYAPFSSWTELFSHSLSLRAFSKMAERIPPVKTQIK